MWFKEISVSIILSILINHSSLAQSKYFTEISKYQQELNTEFKDKEDSPLEKKDLRKFKALEFFDIDSSLRIIATFVRTPGEEAFEMKTSTDRKPIYKKYAEAFFVINEESFMLTVYQKSKSSEKH